MFIQKVKSNRVDLSFKKIVIVESDNSLNRAYELVLQAINGYHVVGAFNNAEDAVKTIKKYKPELVILDVKPYYNKNTDILNVLKEAYPKVKILVNSEIEDHNFITNLFANGAIGLITNKRNYNEFLISVEKAIHSGYSIDENVAKTLVKSVQRNDLSPLTIRETEVLEELARGNTYISIAKSLNISIATVKTHLSHIYWKMGVDGKIEALEMARENRYII